MIVNGKHYQTIWVKEDDPAIIQVIDQRYLPFQFIIEDLKTVNEVATAIKDMHIRGAGLIGATAGYGMYLATLEASKSNAFETFLFDSANLLKYTRPTAVNLAWAVDRQMKAIKQRASIEEKIFISFETAKKIATEDVENCREIGLHGFPLIEKISRKKNGRPVNILTHCNAGWLAMVDYGTATAPVYTAFDREIDIHVWVDETRPRNQGARLTAWELGQHNVPHTIIPDNVGGHLMQHGMVDIVIVGSDRTTITGDVANKTGTYLKALAAKDNQIPFYVALPSSSIDWDIQDGVKDIPIEKRGPEEVKYIEGLYQNKITEVLLAPEDSPAENYGFDVTPSRLVTGLITERGICTPDKKSILKLFPEYNQ